MTQRIPSALSATQLRSIIPLLDRKLVKNTEPNAKACVAAIFRWREESQETLELLLVRRSINERDTWSGQIAFPGGKRELKKTERVDGSSQEVWESSLDTAKRETLEEVGLDLSKPCVRWVGALPPIQTHLRSFQVIAHVFFMDECAEKSAFAPRVQEQEISDAFWVNVQELFDPRRHHELVWRSDEMMRWMAKYPRLSRCIKYIAGNIVFGCIYLPRPGESSQEADMTSPRPIHDFVLWGLTMRIISDIFALSKMDLPMTKDIQPRFQSKFLGRWAILVAQRPEKFLVGAASIAAVGVATSYAMSRL